MGYGDFVVRRSLDFGVRSWTEPKDEKLRAYPMWLLSLCSGPGSSLMKENTGVLWKIWDKNGAGGPFSALMTSISCEADLLDAGQWNFSNEIRYDSSWKEGATAWLEGNAVVTREGEVKDILRVAYGPDDVAGMDFCFRGW